MSTDLASMQLRWAAVWQAMQEADYGGLVVAGVGAIGMYGALQFVTGFFATARGAFAIVQPDVPPLLLLRSDVEQRAVIAEGQVLATTAALNATGADYAAAVGTVARKRVAGRIGVVGLECMSVTVAASLAAALRVDVLDDATAVLDAARSTKTSDDVARIRDAARIADRALQHATASARVGMSERMFAAGIEAQARARGAQMTLVYVSTGEFVARRPLPRPLATADVVTVFVELAAPSGHWVELGAIIAMPHARDAEALAGPCISALRAGANALRPGAEVARVADAMHDVLRVAAVSTSINLGHGVGIDEEGPAISSESCATIARTAMVALHPSAGAAGWPRGCAVANTYVVDERGTAALSELPYTVHRIAQ